MTKINQSSDHNVIKTKTEKRSLHAGLIALRANCWLRVLFGKYTVELVFVMRFLAQVSFSPSITPLFFVPKNVQKICLSKNFVIVALLTHQSYYTSCFLFLLSDSFSHCSFTTYFRYIFMQKLSRPLEF